LDVEPLGGSRQQRTHLTRPSPKPKAHLFRANTIAVNCPTCHTANPEYARFCLNCGTEFVTNALLTCPRCQVGLPAHARFCFACGLALQERTEWTGALERERRVVTILFADVKGFTAMSERLDPEEVVEIMKGAFKALTEPIHRYEGTLVQQMGDAILAFFGAPTAHEDDPERACRAALDILAGIRNYAQQLELERGIQNFAVRVGINTGLVVVGETDLLSRMGYSGMGDAINLASRMETAAEPGTILITADTHKHISHLFETQSRGLLQVKGKAEPVQVFRVLKLTDTAHTRHVRDDSHGLHIPVLGRAEELSQLNQVLWNLRDGKGTPVAVIAETGLGKRRLIAEARQLYGQAVTWVAAHCLAYTSGMSYRTAREMLRGLLGVHADVPLADVDVVLRESVEQTSASNDSHSTAADIYPYLARLLDIPLDEAAQARLEHVSADELQRQILRAFTSYVSAQARRHPLVMVWENLQWIDASSLSVLEALLPLTMQVPLVMLLVFRPNEGGIGDFHQKQRRAFSEKYHVLELAPLTREDSSQLLDNLLNAHASAVTLPTDMREQILERADGNPFFLEEIVRAWLDLGNVRASEGAVPDTLQAVIMARIDRLAPSHKRVLQTAAVIGRSFSSLVLARVLEGTTRVQLAEALSELHRRNFIAPSVKANDDEFTFKHNLTLDVAYNSLLIAQRKALHKLIGETVEAELLGRLDELAPTLAHHFEKAGSGDKALTYLVHAGQRAARLYANTEAIRYYQRALAVAADGDNALTLRQQAHEGLGDVHGLVGAYASSVEQYEQALTLAVVPRERAAFQRKMGRVYERWGKSEQAIVYFEAGLREMREVIDAVETARIYTGMGLVYYRRGELNAALQLSALALDLMERSGDEWGIAQACNNLGIVYGQQSEWVQALAYHHRCLDLWEKLGDANGIAAAHNNLGLVFQQQGAWAQAAKHYETSLACSERVGNRHGLAFTYDNLGQVYQKQGRTQEAMECLKKAVTILFEMGESQIVPEMWQSGAW
jgi:class 3 adenylate cyclase/tetratricopeptide (TPR) repeat protein